MIKSSIEKLSEDIGYDIGMSDDVTQAKLLNGFCRALHNSMNPHQLGMQLCYITEKLSNESCTILKEFAEFIKLKESK